MIKYGILAVAIVWFLVTRDPLIYPYIEPFWMFGSTPGRAALWVGLAGLLVATVFVRNLYCRFLCPLGACLGAALEAHRLPHQAMVRVPDLPDLREGVRVGRHPRPADRDDRVRAVRRLRAAVCGREEVPASPHHHPQGRHPGAPQRPLDFRLLNSRRRRASPCWPARPCTYPAGAGTGAPDRCRRSARCGLRPVRRPAGRWPAPRSPAR